MKKILASDFDGTLYYFDRNPHIASVDKEGIRAFQAQGGSFGVCTGRSLAAVLCCQEDIRMDFYIVGSGATIMNAKQNILYEKHLSYETAKAIYDRFHEDLVNTIVLADNSTYTFHDSTFWPVKFPILKTFDEMEGHAFQGLSLRAKTLDQAVSMTAEINACFPEAKAHQNERSVDVSHVDCDKGKGLVLAKETLGATHSYGIGDSYNDLAMIQAADTSFTFFHAPKDLQGKVDHVVKNIADATQIILQE